MAQFPGNEDQGGAPYASGQKRKSTFFKTVGIALGAVALSVVMYYLLK